MSDIAPIKDKPGQRLFDWQMLVDTAGNTSEYLVVDNGPNGSLREFIEQLEIVPAKFLLLSDLPGSMSKGDFATILTDALTGVTLTVDGESAAAGPVVSRVLPLALTLDAIREIQVLPPSGVGAAALVDITTPGNGKKLNITFPEVPESVSTSKMAKLVFCNDAAFGVSSQPLPNYTTVVKFSSLGSAYIHPDFAGAYDVSTGYFTPPAAGTFLFVADIRFNLGSFGNINADRNWDFGVRFSTAPIAYSSARDTSSEAGLSIAVTKPLTASQSVAPYFYHENGTATPTQPYVVRLGLSIYQILD